MALASSLVTEIVLFIGLFTGYSDVPLSVHTDMVVVARAVAKPDSGLEVRDRVWLKITIPSAFIGSFMIYCLFLTTNC